MMEHRSQSIGFGFLGVEGEQKRNTAAWVDGYRFTGCRDASVGGYEYSKHQASICCIFGGQLGRVEPRGALQNVTTCYNKIKEDSVRETSHNERGDQNDQMLQDR